MAQIKTYGSGRKSKAQEIADAERASETKQRLDAERRATLAAVADADIKKVAAEIVLEKEKNRVPADVEILKKHAEAEKARLDAEKERLEELMEEHRKGKKTFYTGMKMAFGAALKDMERSQETARIASRLGMSNPITSGVMMVGESTGVYQDKVRFVEALCKRFAIRYRAIGSISADDFESPVGT